GSLSTKNYEYFRFTQNYDSGGISGRGGNLTKDSRCKYQNFMPSPQPLSQLWERGEENAKNTVGAIHESPLLHKKLHKKTNIVVVNFAK
ncbi:MAG: hypothetical protein ACRC2J_18410, partial [Microcoleaceae cyanobacterium]